MQLLPGTYPVFGNIRSRISQLDPWQLTVICALLLTAGYNQALFSSMAQIGGYRVFVRMAVLLFMLNLLLCQLGGLGKGQKLWLSLLISISAVCQYFMLNYGALIDKNMLLNALETDASEIQGLLSVQMIPYFLVYLLLPVTILSKAPVAYARKTRKMLWYSLSLVTTLTIMLILIATQYQSYASIFRAHRFIKHQTLPLSALTAAAGLLSLNAVSARSYEPYATDATQQLAAGSKPRLVIFVLGETVRADHLGINGYARNTTPRLAKRQLVNFGAISACGTATALSVPCLFSHLTKDKYDEDIAKNSDNFLDVLQRAGIKVYWRNNNSGCKTMCNRIEQDNQFAADSRYHCADGSCPDLALLHGLKQRIPHLNNAQQSVLLVLHQQGNHGPEYYKRSLPEHKVFMPECRTNLLNECDSNQIINAYDNAIVSTDLLLDETISLLETYSGEYDTALVYLSDHGESLGEKGVYLHGLPYWMAPSAQTQVPLFFWLSDNLQQRLKANPDCITQKDNVSHDHIFDTMLALFAVNTAQARTELNLLWGCSNAS